MTMDRNNAGWGPWSDAVMANADDLAARVAALEAVVERNLQATIADTKRGAADVARLRDACLWLLLSCRQKGIITEADHAFLRARLDGATLDDAPAIAPPPRALPADVVAAMREAAEIIEMMDRGGAILGRWSWQGRPVQEFAARLRALAGEP